LELHACVPKRLPDSSQVYLFGRQALLHKSAEAEFSSLFIPTFTDGEFREGGLNIKY
jgi:hypothetical protein